MDREDTHEHDILLQFIEQVHLEIKNGFRNRAKMSAACASRPNEQFFANLDSSVKRSTAFMRKIKHYTPSQLPSLIADISALNLTKYVSEIAVALTESKWKTSEIDAAAEICCALHVNYADFAASLISNWKRAFNEKTLNGTKLRTDMLLLVSCLCAGVISADAALPTLRAALERVQPDDVTHACALLSLAKHHGHALAGLVPATVARAACAAGQTVPRNTMLSETQQKSVCELFKGYFAALCDCLRASHAAVEAHARGSKRILKLREQLSTERRAAGSALTERLQRLKGTVENFADALDEPAPELGETCSLDADVDEDDGLHVLGLPGHVYGIADEAWANEEAMFFYRRLPDVSRFVPAKRHSEIAEEETLIDDAVESPDSTLASGVDADDDVAGGGASCDDDVKLLAGNKSELAEFLGGLHKCANQSMVDEAAMVFLARFNRKSARQRLVGQLHRAPANRMHLVPLFARLVAVVKPAAPDVAVNLAFRLKQDFRQHVRKKDQLRGEAKALTMRYIGELVKFDCFPRVEALCCVRTLLADFTHHNLEMCCHLVESCGRYLLQHSRSRDRMQAYLERMSRLRTASVLDARYLAMVDGALWAAHGQSSTRRARAVHALPPLHAFLRAQLLDVGTLGVDQVTALLLRIDWSDEPTAQFVASCLASAHHSTHAGAAQFAQLTAQLAQHVPEVAVHVVDAVVEDIQLGVELDWPAMNQRRVAAVRYLGQLYLYRVVDHGVVFDTLYTLLYHGPCVEPPRSLIRMRLICTLLELCGPYFDQGPSAQRLDDFLALFHHYVLVKRSHPLWTATSFPPLAAAFYKDVVSKLRPTALVDDLAASAAAARSALARWNVQVAEEGEVVAAHPDAVVDSLPLATVDEDNAEDADEQDFQRRLDELLEQSATRPIEPARLADLTLPMGARGLRTLPEEGDAAVMCLTLMLRKGSKTQYKRVLLPRDAQLLRKQRQTEQAERAEKERIKRLTLNISRRLQYEEEQAACRTSLGH